MKNYKIQFTDRELTILNTVDAGLENSKMRRSLQSLYSYLLKNTENGIKELEITFKILHKKYTRWHAPDLKETSLKERIYRLRDLGLLTIKKIGRKNSYFVTRGSAAAVNPTENPTIEKVAKTTENTNLEANNELHKYINNTNNKDIDTKSTTGKTFDYNEYLANSKKVTSFLMVLKKTRELLKEMKVKSLDIESKVIDAMSKSYRNVTEANLENYIRRVIQQKREKYYYNFNKYIAPQKFRKTTANFTQRTYTDQQIKEIEEIVSMW